MTKEDELVDFIKESLNEQSLYNLVDDFYESYDFFPNSEDKNNQKCMYCFKHTTVSSHSVSRNQLEDFALGKEKPL